MKKITLTLALLAFTLSAKSQLIQVETGANPAILPNYQIAVLVGFKNWQDDSFTAGFLYKNFEGLSRKAIRAETNLTLSKHFFIMSDIYFFDKYVKDNSSNEASALELSAGLGARIFGFTLKAGSLMEDFDPRVYKRKEDQPIVVFGYNIPLKK